MKDTKLSFFRKPNDFLYIGLIIVLIALQGFLRKIVPPDPSDTSSGAGLDLFFNLLLSLCLFGYYIKKYNPDYIRQILMAFFFTELIVGIFLKKLSIQHSNEIVFIGFLGILVVWLNTHMNRRKFLMGEE